MINWLSLLPVLASGLVLLIFFLLAPRRTEKYCNQCKRHWGKDAPLIMMDKKGKQMNFCDPNCRDQYLQSHPE